METSVDFLFTDFIVPTPVSVMMQCLCELFISWLQVMGYYMTRLGDTDLIMPVCLWCKALKSN